MRFLDMHRHTARYSQKNICMIRQFAASLARHGDGVYTCLTRRDTGGNHIRRIATGRNGDQHVASLAKRFNLAAEHAFIPEIIGIGRQERGVGRQRQCGKAAARPAMVQRGDKLGCQMLGVACRATIATQHQLATSLQRGGDHMCCLHRRLAAAIRCLALDLCRGQ